MHARTLLFALLLLMGAHTLSAGSISLTDTLARSYCNGARVALTWTYSAPLTSSSELIISLSNDGGKTYAPVAKAPAGARAFKWPVPIDQMAGTKYRLKISHASGSSQTAVFAINPHPEITKQPASAAVLRDESHIFSVAPIGSGYSYQWRLNGKDVSGANGSEFSVVATDITVGSYSVVVSNACSSTTSMSAGLSIRQ